MKSSTKDVGRKAAQLLFFLASIPATGQIWAQSVAFDPGMPSGALSPNPALHLGRFDFHGGASGTGAYDDLVSFDASGRPISDVTWTLSPWGSVQTEGPNARIVRAFYQPSFLFFTEHSDLNTVNHAGNFSLNWPFNNLTLSLQENVSVVSFVPRDVAARSTYSSYATLGTANYALSDRTSLIGTVSYTPIDYGGQLVSYDAYSEQLSVEYEFNPKFKGGVGVTASQVVVQNAPTQTSEGPLVHASYVPDPTLSFDASVGLVIQQFGNNIPSSVAETFSLSGNYQMSPTTTFTLRAHRSEVPSGILVGQNFTETGFGASVRQELIRRIQGTLDFGYTSADYYAVEAGVNSQRTDNYFYIRSNLTMPLTSHWSISVFYEHDGNTSSDSTFQYDRNTAGVQGAWSF